MIGKQPVNVDTTNRLQPTPGVLVYRKSEPAVSTSPGPAEEVAEQKTNVRACPTRIQAAGPDEAARPTITHLINIPECQKRQREMYHKCWTCSHANALAHRPKLAGPPVKDGLPPLIR